MLKSARTRYTVPTRCDTLEYLEEATENESMTTLAMAVSAEEDLRYWLANEDWYPSQYTRQWLERTPAEEAADTLAHVAEDAQPEPRAFWSVAITFLSIAGLTTSDGIAGSGPGARKAGTRAALLLIERDDPRGVAPLARVFSTDGILQSKYQEQIEQALTVFLSRNEAQAKDAPYLADLRTLAHRLWQVGSLRDLSQARADLLLVLLRFLQTAGGEANQAVLQSITGTTVKTANRLRVRTAVAEMLDTNPSP